MTPRFFITDENQEKPSSKRTIYADGSKDKDFREGHDLELSHWVPNITPAEFKADTSTEICLNYVANSPDRDWDLAINNHTDVDGVLSIFALTQSKLALEHRNTVIAAAEMGDFFNWAGRPGQLLFQCLTLIINRLSRQQENPQFIYQNCLAEIPAILARQSSLIPEAQPGLDALERSLECIESSKVKRTLVHERFAHYHIPRELVRDLPALKRARKMPSFNALLDDSTLLLPQARNKEDRERIQLISIAGEEGSHFDLHYPAYSWAETPNSWRAPGLQISDSVNVYHYSFQALSNALSALNEREERDGDGFWEKVKKLTPFTTSLKRKYPVFASFMGKNNGYGLSSLKPDQVAETLAEAFSN
jgi:hypothetical protein